MTVHCECGNKILGITASDAPVMFCERCIAAISRRYRESMNIIKVFPDVSFTGPYRSARGVIARSRHAALRLKAWAEYRERKRYLDAPPAPDGYEKAYLEFWEPLIIACEKSPEFESDLSGNQKYRITNHGCPVYVPLMLRIQGEYATDEELDLVLRIDGSPFTRHRACCIG